MRSSRQCSYSKINSRRSASQPECEKRNSPEPVHCARRVDYSYTHDFLPPPHKKKSTSHPSYLTRQHALSEHPRNCQPSRGLCGVEDAQQLQRVILNHSVLMNVHDMGGTTRLRNLVGGLRHELPQRQRLRHLPDEPVHLEEAYQAPYKEPHLRRSPKHGSGRCDDV